MLPQPTCSHTIRPSVPRRYARPPILPMAETSSGASGVPVSTPGRSPTSPKATAKTANANNKLAARLVRGILNQVFLMPIV